MELVVGALVVLALIAILIRFAFRDASGAVRLPRIIDQSIGMWVVRRLLGRPTERDVDPFARFRRPSTVLARRPGGTHTSRAEPRPSSQSGPPPVLRDANEAPELPPAWSTIERRRTGDRAFGASILAPAPEPPRPSRARSALLYGVLFVAVAIGGLAVGALAGLAAGPDAPAGTASAALHSGPPPAGSTAPSSR